MLIFKGYIYESQNIPSILEIEGVSRPTRNNRDKLIHHTIEGIVNFWKWFGDSKTVDSRGRPIEFYHGSTYNTNFDIVNVDIGVGNQRNTGFFLTDDIDIVNTYAGSRGNIKPFYIKAINPVIIDANNSNWNNIGDQAKIDVPDKKIAASKIDEVDEDLELYKELGGDLNELKGEKTVKGFKSNVGQVIPSMMTYSTDMLAKWTKSNGYSVLLITNIKDSGPYHEPDQISIKPHTVAVVINPNVLKSSVGNNGSFSEDPKITI